MEWTGVEGNGVEWNGVEWSVALWCSLVFIVQCNILYSMV